MDNWILHSAIADVLGVSEADRVGRVGEYVAEAGPGSLCQVRHQPGR